MVLSVAININSDKNRIFQAIVKNKSLKSVTPMTDVNKIV